MFHATLKNLLARKFRLVTTGFYLYIRHPSYLGAMLGAIGWVLVFRSALGLIPCALLIPFFFFIVPAEEALLHNEFGAAYDEYRKRTWRLIPYIF